MAQDLDLQIKIEALSQQAQQALESLSKAFADLASEANGSTKPLDKSSSAADKAAKSFKSAGESLDKFGKSISEVGKSISLRITAPILAFGAFSVKAASDAEESFSKFSVVFRDVSSEADLVAESFRKNFGLSSLSSKQLLSDTGNLLTGFGFTGKAALDLSRQVNELAVDLASFTNFSGGAQGASAALTKALLGERESIKSLGIAIQEEDVIKRVSLNSARGLVFATERQAKAYATLTIAQEQAKNAIGDFARTQQSFANQTRILTNNFSDFAITIGQALLPYATSLVRLFNDAITKLNGLNEETRRSVIVFSAIAASIGPALIGIGSLVRVLGFASTGLGKLISVLKPLAILFSGSGLIVAGIIATAAALAGTINVFSKLREAGVNTAQAVGLAFNLLATFLAKEYIGLLSSGLEKLGALIGFVRPAFGKLIEEAASGLGTIASKIGTSFESTKAQIDALLAPIGEDAASAFTFGFSKEFESFMAQFKDLGKIAGKNLGDGVAEGVKEPVFSMYEFLKSQSESIGQTISGNLASSFLDVAEGTKSAKQAMEDFARSTLRYIAQIILQQSILNALRAAAPGFFGVSGGSGASAGGGAGGVGSVTAATGGLIRNNKVQRYNNGGPVVGPGGPTSDMVPAWLSNGEFVLKASAVRALGSRFLHGLNQVGSKGGIPAFADGGMVSGGMGTKISIENMGSQKQVAGAEQDPTTGVITIFLEDIGKNGPISKSIQSTFNVRRGGFR